MLLKALSIILLAMQILAQSHPIELTDYLKINRSQRINFTKEHPNLKIVNNGNEHTLIDEEIFSGCCNLMKIILPDNLASIEYRAFSRCFDLNNITLPKGLTSIGESAFYKCTALTNITLPNSLTSIGLKVFYGCTALTNITLPNSLTSIGFKVFYGCTALTNITLPNSLTSIGKDAFCGCTSLENINISLNELDDCLIFGYNTEETQNLLTKIESGETINNLKLNNNKIFMGAEKIDQQYLAKYNIFINLDFNYMGLSEKATLNIIPKYRVKKPIM